MSGQTETHVYIFPTLKALPLTILLYLSLGAATSIFQKAGKIFIPHLQE